tara:strand:- start:6 stop:416 length:411 start_codon:yes stop_codon:yes gene_type:complete
MSLLEIKDKNIVLARYVPNKHAWKDGLNFFSVENEYIQVGTWGYNNKKELNAHTHNVVHRKVDRTQEVIYVKSGKILAQIYNLSEKLVKEIEVASGDIIILLNGGHGYKILEDNTQVLEIKNGPYPGAEKDRRRFD